MSNHIIVMFSTVLKELKTIYRGVSYFFKLFGDVTRTIVLAWIVYASGDRELMAFLCVGAALLAMWTGMVAMGGWSLSSELIGKTLDFILISHSSMPVVLFGKTLAQMIFEMISGAAAVITVFVVVHGLPQVADPILFFISILFALLGLSALGFFFAPLVVMAGGRPGFFMGIVPFGAVLSGLIMPLERLPFPLHEIAYCFPASWAMEGVWKSIVGFASIREISILWGMCLCISIVWFSLTYVMCKIVENKIRRKGTLGVF